MKGKVKMSAIEDVNDRMTSYRKRKETLIRKMEEITKLCGVEASLILFNELEVGGGMTWPANHEGVLEMMEKVKFDMGKRHDMDSLVEAMVAKEKLSRAKLQFSIDDKEARQMMSECFSGETSVKDLWAKELERLKYVIDDKHRSLRARMRNLMQPENPGGLNVVAETMPMGNGGQDLAGPSGAGMSSCETMDGGWP